MALGMRRHVASFCHELGIALITIYEYVVSLGLGVLKDGGGKTLPCYLNRVALAHGVRCCGDVGDGIYHD